MPCPLYRACPAPEQCQRPTHLTYCPWQGCFLLAAPTPWCQSHCLSVATLLSSLRAGILSSFLPFLLSLFVPSFPQILSKCLVCVRQGSEAGRYSSEPALARPLGVCHPKQGTTNKPTEMLSGSESAAPWRRPGVVRRGLGRPTQAYEQGGNLLGKCHGPRRKGLGFSEKQPEELLAGGGEGRGGTRLVHLCQSLTFCQDFSYVQPIG